MFTKLSKWVTEHPKKIISFWIIFLLASAYFALQLPGILSAGGFNDPSSDSMRVKEMVSEEFTNRYSQNAIVVIQHDSLTVEDASYQSYVEEIENQLLDVQHVEQITSYYQNQNKQFVSKDKLTTYLIVGLDATEDEATNIAPVLQEELSLDIVYGIYNELARRYALIFRLDYVKKREVMKAELMAIPGIRIILLLIFRTISAAVVTLVVAPFALVG